MRIDSVWGDTSVELSDFDAFYYRTRDRAYEHAKDVIRDEQLAEDALQEAYARISTIYSKLTFETSAAECAYVCRAARNAAIDIMRKNDPLDSADQLTDIPFYLDDPFDIIAAKETVEVLRKCFRKLNERAQAVLSYRNLNLTDKVIAKTLGISVNQVRVTALRARRKLWAEARKEGVVFGKR